MAARRHNTQTDRDRRKLVEDFESRLRYNEQEGEFRNWLVRPRSHAWVVHPLADETELLRELGITADACRSSDAYWRFGDSVYFVQFETGTDLAGVYYYFDTWYRQDRFRVFLSTPVVATSDLHQTFERLERLIDEGVIERERALLTPTGERWTCREGPL